VRAPLIEPFYVMKVLERAKELEREGKRVIHFEVGEPDLPVPDIVKRRASEALRDQELKYTESTGIPLLKERIAEFYYNSYGVNVSPERVIITPGSSIGLLAVLKVVRERVGGIAFTDPGYPCYRNMMKFLGFEGEAIKLSDRDGFSIPAGDFSTDSIVVNSPSNPTGKLIAAKDYRRLSEKAFIISDEIYHGIVYGGRRASTVLEVTEDAVVVNGFSKFFLMTGWRVGWLVVPDWMVEDVRTVLQNIAISAPTLSQIAAVSCFEEECMEELRGNVETFERRRNLMLSGLKEIGFNVPLEPEGAFYVYADVSRFTDDSFRFSFELLERAGVAVTPGRDFGSNMAERFVRFSFCTDENRIEEGMERLYRFLR